jgi:hypothetical protein
MAFGQYLGLITGVIGAIIGGVLGGIGTYGFGAPAGAAWGFTIGSMIGGIAGQVFWPEKADINTPPPPQPHETRLQFSSWGMAIPIQYGDGRMAGNIIYMSDIKETIERSRHRQDGVRYYEMIRTYTATFAIAFCEGPVPGVARLWMNNKVFADWRDPTGEYYPVGDYALAVANVETTVARAAAYFSVYLGSESQSVDPTISTLLTAAEVPAYRGIFYIVFKDFPIGEFSGVPNIEVEVGDYTPVVFEMPSITNGGWTFGINGYYNDNSFGVGMLPSRVDGNTRFPNLFVPAGSTITSAKVTGFAYGPGITGRHIIGKLKVELVDDATDITSYADFYSRSWSTDFVEWDEVDSYPSYPTFAAIESPDFTPLLQKIIDRPGWVSGNSVQIGWFDNGSDNTGIFIAVMQDGIYTGAKLKVEFF